MNIRKSKEQGQAIVFLIVGLVVFLGFVGLAIDGGMAYADRRHTQNAADSAALAAAGLLALEMDNQSVGYSSMDCNSGAMQTAIVSGVQAAISRAAANGFAIDSSYADGNGVQTQCFTTDYGYTDRYIDVTVRISDTTTTSFAHLFIPDALQINTEAVSRVRPRMPLAFGNAIVALNPADCSGNQNGAKFHGDPAVYVTGGGIWTNGCLRGVGNIDVVVDPPEPGIHYVSDYDGGGSFVPAPQDEDFVLPPESYEIDAPDCSQTPYNNVTDSWLLDHSPLSPGLYCVTGAIKINGGDVLRGSDVTIVILDGDMKINGNAEVQLDAPPRNPDPWPAVPGILFYIPPSNSNRIQINGNSSSYFEGTVLGTAATIDVLGTGSVDAFRAQIIGWNVEVGGTADTYVNFQEQNMYSKPTSLELAK
ncbi:MAG: Tad domain-containing protein [Anaerolineales bacterium]|nr:Tad domain-containing protein [Anaerolineales bacterium]